jgi:hypothetical protein
MTAQDVQFSTDFRFRSNVSHALVRAVFALLRTQNWQKEAFTRV